MGVSRPKERREKMSRLAVEDEKRMIHVLAVVAVVMAPLLIAVGGVSG